MIDDPTERQRLERILADIDRRLADTPLPDETRQKLKALSKRLRRQLSPGWMPADLRRCVAMAARGLLSPRLKAGVAHWLRPNR